MKDLPISEVMNRELLLARENMTVGELATFLTRFMLKPQMKSGNWLLR